MHDWILFLWMSGLFFFFFFPQFLNVPMFRNVTMKCLTEIGKGAFLFILLIYIAIISQIQKVSTLILKDG